MTILQRWDAVHRFARMLLISSLALPLLAALGSPPDFTPLVYLCFAIALLARRPIHPIARPFTPRRAASFAGLLMLCGLVTECLAWLSQFLARSDRPALLHPQLLPDLMLAAGFYGGWALAWILGLRRWPFTLGEVVVTNGLAGIVVEGQGSALLAFIATLLANPLGALLGALYLVAVYGAIVGLAYWAVGTPVPNRRSHWVKYPLVGLLLVVVPVVMTGGVAVLATLLGLLPERRPIWEHPLL